MSFPRGSCQWTTIPAISVLKIKMKQPRKAKDNWTATSATKENFVKMMTQVRSHNYKIKYPNSILLHKICLTLSLLDYLNKCAKCLFRPDF